MTSPQTTLAAAYVHAVNTHNPAAFQALFAPEAVVDDAGRTFAGIDAIKAWSDSDIFAADVTFRLLAESAEGGDVVLTTEVDGNFDRTGLPDPVVIRHRLHLSEGRVRRLTCQLA
jgi:hypothetical protein